MCELCEQEDPTGLFDYCVCIRCGNPVCFDALSDNTEGLVKPSFNWDEVLMCETCDMETQSLKETI